MCYLIQHMKQVVIEIFFIVFLLETVFHLLLRKVLRVRVGKKQQHSARFSARCGLLFEARASACFDTLLCKQRRTTQENSDLPWLWLLYEVRQSRWGAVCHTSRNLRWTIYFPKLYSPCMKWQLWSCLHTCGLGLCLYAWHIASSTHCLSSRNTTKLASCAKLRFWPCSKHKTVIVCMHSGACMPEYCTHQKDVGGNCS